MTPSNMIDLGASARNWTPHPRAATALAGGPYGAERILRRFLRYEQIVTVNAFPLSPERMVRFERLFEVSTCRCEPPILKSLRLVLQRP